MDLAIARRQQRLDGLADKAGRRLLEKVFHRVVAIEDRAVRVDRDDAVFHLGDDLAVDRVVEARWLSVRG
ncbi:hypothetical protein D3C72_2231670 [compost metagenome]